MADYTPTTEEVRADYLQTTAWRIPLRNRPEAFDRWLATITEERDAALADSARLFEKKNAVQAERDAALAVIEKARAVTDEYDAAVDAGEHRGCLGDTACEACELNERYRVALAAVDTSALAARDAEKWNEGFDAGRWGA